MATSTVHEWLEDQLPPNSDTIDAGHTFTDADVDTDFPTDNLDRFRIGDQVQADGSREVMIVVGIATSAGDLQVQRGYGGTTAEDLTPGQVLRILGNAAVEGDDSPAARFTNRSRVTNYTQIFTAAVEVSGTEAAVSQIGVADELDYQKTERLRELVRDLENSVINGVARTTAPEGSGGVRRTMNGIIGYVNTNVFTPGAGGIPAGDGAGSDELNEAVLNAALRLVWDESSGNIDTIVVNGLQKRRINNFITSARQFTPRTDRFKDLLSVYESDFGVCRVVLSRWVPADTVLLLDSSRIDVLPLAGRSFHYKPLASTGDRDVGQLIGEYALELRNENAHGLVRGLAVS